jgi:hypothetical protein
VPLFEWSKRLNGFSSNDMILRRFMFNKMECVSSSIVKYYAKWVNLRPQPYLTARESVQVADQAFK